MDSPDNEKSRREIRKQNYENFYRKEDEKNFPSTTSIYGIIVIMLFFCAGILAIDTNLDNQKRVGNLWSLLIYGVIILYTALLACVYMYMHDRFSSPLYTGFAVLAFSFLGYIILYRLYLLPKKKNTSNEDKAYYCAQAYIILYFLGKIYWEL